jgi:hypothetical protein
VLMLFGVKDSLVKLILVIGILDASKSLFESFLEWWW